MAAFPYQLIVKFAFGSYAIGDVISDPGTILAIEASPYATYVVQDYVLPAPVVAPIPPTAPVYVQSLSLVGYTLTVLNSDGTSATISLPIPPSAAPVTLASITDVKEFLGTPGNLLSLDATGKLLDEPLNLAAIGDVAEYSGSPGNFLALDATGKMTDVPPTVASLRDLRMLAGPPLSYVIIDAGGNVAFQAIGVPTLSITTPVGAVVGVPIVLSGGCVGATPAAMDYSIDFGVTWFALAPFSAAGGTWSGTGPTPLTAAPMTITVRDHANQTVLVGTPSFLVANPSGETLTLNNPVSATQGVTIPLNGTYAGGVPAAMDYSVNAGATWVGIATFAASGGFWSGTGPTPAAPGSMQITVRDHTNTTVSVTGAPFVVVASVSGGALPAITSPVFGLDALSGGGQFFQDQLCSVPATFGAAVGGFASLVTPRDQLIADVNTAPTLVATAHNGLPGLRFSAAAATLLYPSPFSPPTFLGILDGNAIAPSPMTILAVFTPASAPTPAAWMSVLTAGVSTLGGLDQIVLGLSPTDLHFSIRVAGQSNSVSVAAPPTAGGLVKAVVRFSNFSTPISVAVAGQAEATLQPSGAMGGEPWDVAWLGGAMDSGAAYQSFDGWLHELRIWSEPATSAQRDALLAYATAKWGS